MSIIVCNNLVCLFFLIIFSQLMQSLLAALGSIQFVSNIAFAYFVLNKMVTVKYVKIWTELIFRTITWHTTLLSQTLKCCLLFYRILVATAFIVLGNIFLVAFGNHQSPGMWLTFETSVSLYFMHTAVCTAYLLNHIFWVISIKHSNINVVWCVSHPQS